MKTAHYSLAIASVLSTTLFSQIASADDASSALTAEERIRTYVSSWTEEDPAKRLALLEKAVSEDFIYRDPQTDEANVVIDSREDLSEWIGNFQNDIKNWGLWPVGGGVASNIDLRQGADEELTTVGRFLWEFNSFGGSYTWAEGDDFVSFNEDGELASVNGFFGKLIEICGSADWQEQAYNGGEQVTYQGATWQAKWWTDIAPNSELSEAESTWINLGACTAVPAQ